MLIAGNGSQRTEYFGDFSKYDRAMRHALGKATQISKRGETVYAYGVDEITKQTTRLGTAVSGGIFEAKSTETVYKAWVQYEYQPTQEELEEMEDWSNG